MTLSHQISSDHTWVDAIAMWPNYTGNFDPAKHFCLVMDLWGPSLLQRLKANHVYSLPNLQKIAQQLFLGLQDIHEAHFVHGDIKPGNVLTDLLDPCTIRIADLGTLVTEQVASTTDRLWTISHAAPEAFFGGPRSSAGHIWAMGCLHYQLSTGKACFVGSNSSCLVNQQIAD